MLLVLSLNDYKCGNKINQKKLESFIKITHLNPNMNTENSTSKKRGRPRIDITWPENSFTVKDIIESMETPPSNVLVHLKIKEGLNKGRLKQVGKKSSRVGRPQNVYQVVGDTGEQQNQTQNQTQEQTQDQKQEPSQGLEW